MTRRSARIDRSQALNPHDLTERERRVLLQIDAHALERYAQSLLDKRYQELRRAAPHTARLSVSLKARHRRGLQDRPLPVQDTVLPPGIAQGLWLLEVLHPELRQDPEEAPHVADLFAFEVLAGASRIDGEVRTARCEYRIDRLIADLQRDRLPTELEPEPVIFRFTADDVQWRPR